MNTERIFTQKVVMPCTKEQYEELLKDDLERMGYDTKYVISEWWHEAKYLANIWRYHSGTIANGTWHSLDCADFAKETILTEFMPDIFLGLCAMTDNETFGYGELLIATQCTSEFEDFDMLECSTHDKGVVQLTTCKGYYSDKFFRRATVKEIKTGFAGMIKTSEKTNEGKMIPRKFIQPVSMHCSQTQCENDLIENLENIGYDVSGLNFDEYNMILCEGRDLYTTDSEQGCFVNEYNPELFLALAAMSEGDSFYAGEWVWSNYGHLKAHLGRVVSVDGKTLWIEPKQPGESVNFNVHDSFVSKLTVDELILNLSSKKTNDPEFVKEYKEQSFFEQNIPADIKPEPEVMEELSKLSRILSDWTPDYGSMIHVWNDDSIKRQPGFFIGFDNQNRVIASFLNPSFAEYEKMTCQVFDCFCKFGEPVRIPLRDAQETLAEIYGVHPEQIIIEQ